ncbi:MAG: FHA domain-containing protein [Anaerolineae bacterium]
MNLDLETRIFLLRMGFVALLYLFLFVVVVIIWWDLQVASRRAGEPRRRYGQLIVVDGGGSGLSPGDAFPLRPVTSLGRALTNTIVLPDPAASAEHALLAYRDGQWWLEDLGSTNGTFLNDARLEEPAIVGEEDVIRVGQVKLKLSLEVARG